MSIFEALEHVEPPKKKAIFFRLYYNKKNGEPVCYSMEDLEGDYINITPEQFALCDPHVKVEDGEIVKRNELATAKIKPGGDQFRVHPTDISLIDPNGDHWSKEIT